MINSLSTARSFFRALPCGEYHTQRGETSRWGNPPDPNLSFSSARRKELKEASTYPKPFPIWKGCNCRRAETALRQSFCIARKACAPYGASDSLFTSLLSPPLLKTRHARISDQRSSGKGAQAMRQPIKNISRVPRYQNGEKSRFLRLFVLHPLAKDWRGAWGVV